jgi:hypothetical protein
MDKFLHSIHHLFCHLCHFHFRRMALQIHNSPFDPITHRSTYPTSDTICRVSPVIATRNQ